MSDTDTDTDREQQRIALALQIMDRLRTCYLIRPAAVADACDEQIDRSGNLLGWVRAAAAMDKEQTR